jgi:hypothetical protein
VGGRVEVWIHSFLTSWTGGSDRSDPLYVALHVGKILRCVLNTWLGGTQTRALQEEFCVLELVSWRL